MEKLQSDNKAKNKYQSYYRLVLDTYQSTRFLSSLELGNLDEVLAVFRDNLFDRSENGRKRIPHLI